jgi:hypothetical protein
MDPYPLFYYSNKNKNGQTTGDISKKIEVGIIVVLFIIPN